MAIKGRSTLRKGQLVTDPGTVRVPLWELDAKPGTPLAKLEAGYLAALDAVDQLDAHRQEIGKSGVYTETGAKTAALDFAAQKLSPRLKAGRRAVEDAKRAAAEQRSKIKLHAPDKTDFVGAFLRSEMRGWFWNKPQAERDRFLSENLSKLDPEFARALIELPREMVGIAESHRGILMDAALRAQHGTAIDEVTDLEKGIEIAERTLQLSEEALIKDCGTDSATFEAKGAPYTPAPPWLRKVIRNGTEAVEVVDIDSGVQRPATAEEIQAGRYYRDHDDYQRDRAA